MKRAILVAMLTGSLSPSVASGSEWTDCTSSSALSAVAGAGAGLVLSAAVDERDPGWRWHDTALELVFAGVTTVDMLQTVSFRQNGTHEVNPILGQYPSRLRVVGGIGLAVLGHAAIAYVLPRPWRTIWQTMWLGVEVDAVGHNVSAGIRISL